MGLAFKLNLPADKRFLSIWEIPKLTASAIYPPQTGEPALTESGLDLEEIKHAACVSQHERALDKAIDAGMVTLLNPLSYEVHTFPFGDARNRAVITLDDFKLFAASLQIEVVLDSAPWTGTPSPEGYLTIEEAASALARKYGFNAPTSDTMLNQISVAADTGALTVRHPHTLLPYTPETRRNFYELVSVADLNAWLEKQGAVYRLDGPEQADSGNSLAWESCKESGGIPGKQPPHAVGRLAIKAAYEIELKTKRQASAKEVMAQLQAWAIAGDEPDVLTKPLPENRAVQWLTAKREHREYTSEACQETLKKWKKSRH